MNNKTFSDSLKSALIKFNPMHRNTWKYLIQLGFSDECGKKHYKIIYHGKKKNYLFPVSVTSSDKKMVLNMKSVIMNSIGDEL